MKDFKPRLVIFLIFACTSSWAQLKLSSDFNKNLDSYLAIHFQNKDFSGGITISQNGKIIYSKNMGFENFENKITMTDESKIRIASVTKTFVAGSIVMLLDRGKVSLDDRLEKYISGFPYGSKVSIEHLLLHAGGIPSLAGSDLSFNPLATKDSVLAYLKSQPLKFEPGTNDSYSNEGYFLLATIIEVVSGQSFEGFITKNFLSKLGMLNTGDYDSYKIISNKASAYSPGPYDGIMVTPYYNMVTSFGSGSLFSTAKDLNLWGQSILNKTFIDMYKCKYPYGWGRRKLGADRYLSQTGYNEGYNSLLLVFENGLVISYVNNIGNLLFNKIEKDIPAILFGMPYDKPVGYEKKQLDDQVIKQFVGTYLGNDKPFFRISENSGDLYFSFFDSKFKNYLMPINNNELLNKAEFSRLRLVTENNQVIGVSISFGPDDKGTVFRKK